MTQNLAEKAEKLMLGKETYNCAQAIITTYGEQLGMDHETSYKIASAFGGGIGGMGNTCGALTGAAMVLGLKYGGLKGEDQRKAHSLTGNLYDEFKSLNGTIICRELINHDLLTDEDIQKAYKNEAFKNCPKFVKDTAEILEKLL